jgi:hypothetical protein
MDYTVVLPCQEVPMTRVLMATLVFAAFLAPASLSAKFETVLIELRAPTLAGPVRSTDPLVRQFDVWSGMGTGRLTLAQAEGFIADWKAGPIAEPARGLPRYDVLFYGAGCSEPGPACDGHYTLTYVVIYVRDSATGRGYVYFPGPGETLAAINGPSIYRGPTVEGRWFRTTSAWDIFAATMLTGAVVARG